MDLWHERVKEDRMKSIDAIREAFPALRRTHEGRPVAYFDGPGGTQVPQTVVDAMSDYLIEHNANTHWAFPSSHETDAMIADARATFADFLNASPNEIVFGANMTTLTFHLSRALGRSCGKGDEVVVTELDHHANVAPWQALARERGVTLRIARMIPETGQLDWESLAKQINNRTKLVAIGAASNALGTITDVRRAAKMVHEAGARIFVDAVHYAPHDLVDVRSLDCDFLACSAYKFYGPHIGVLFGRHELLTSIEFPKLAPAPDTAPERAETGTQNHEGIAGAAAAVGYLASLAEGENRREHLQRAFARLRTRGRELVTRLWEGLERSEEVQLFGPSPNESRTPTVAFTVRGIPPLTVAEQLASEAVFVSHGDFYAATAIERLSQAPEGVVRAGCACYTTEEEIDRLIAGVVRLAKK